MMIIEKEEYFIKLPNNLVWTYEEGEKSLISELNSKTTMVLTDLMFRCNWNGICYFTLEDIIIELGYTPRTGKGKINEQFKEILISLEDSGFIYDSNVSMKEIKSSTFIKCKINSNIPKDEYDNDIQFFRVFYTDFQKVINIKSNLDKDIMLNVFYYINSRIKHRADDDRSMSCQVRFGEGKSEYTYFKYTEVTKDLSIAEQTFKEHIDVLKENKLIYFGNIGLVEKDGYTKVSNNIYTIDKEEFEVALMDSEYWHEMNGYRIIGKKTDIGTKRIIGLSSRINQLKDNNYDTSKLEKKLFKLETSKALKERDKDRLLEDIKKLMTKLEMDKVIEIKKSFEEEYCAFKDVVDNVDLLLILEKKLKDELYV